MYRYHALGGASLLVLGSALALVPSAAEAQTALPAVTVEAPRGTAARPAARKPAVRSSARTQARPPSANPAPAASLTAGITPSVARALLYQAPTGQTETTIDRSQFDNRPAFSVADVLRESPGISVKQGNGPRDIGISIRGSNARNGFGIRNLVIFDDGFPVTQPDGLSRSDLIDPKAYAAIDVIRGPSSALYGNYATGGALNFRTRPGRTIDGVEYGVEGGSFGYLNNYLAAGKKVGNFEYSLFASDARGDGFIGNSWFNTQTVNFLGTLHATPDDRFTVKFINNNLDTRLPLRYTLDQFYQNPFQRGCDDGPASHAAVQRSPCSTTASTALRTPTDRRAGGPRPQRSPDHRRRAMGARFRQHDDLAQPVRVRRSQHQPADRRHQRDRRFSVVQLHERRHQARRNFRLGVHHLFRRLLQYADRVERHAQCHAGRQRDAWHAAEQYLERHHQLWRSRARGTQADAATDGGCRHRMGNDASEGHQYGLQLRRRRMSRRTIARSDIRRPAIPEHRARAGAALQAESRMAVPWRASLPDTARRRSATSSSSPTATTATTRS